MASRSPLARRGSPPAFTATTTSSTVATAGTQAVAWAASPACTHQTRAASASASTCRSTSGSPVAVWTSHAPSRSPAW